MAWVYYGTMHSNDQKVIYENRLQAFAAQQSTNLGLKNRWFLQIYGSLQSLDWTGGLDWWTGLKINCMLSTESLPEGLHLET